jgi:putative MATE family efflux protein
LQPSAPPTPSTTAPRPPGALWRDLREAIHGSTQDYTTGSIGRAALLLAVPMVLEMAMESLFAVVDVFFVARLGAAAVATVGITEGLLTPVIAVAFGVGAATTALVARRVGEHDAAGAARAGVHAIGLGMVIAVAVGLAGWLLGERLLRGMGAAPEVVAGSGYSRVLLGGSGTVLLLFVGNAVFRGAGDAAIAMRVLWLANLINIVLDPCFIFGLGPFPEMGVTGAAVATTIGRGVGVVYLLVRLARGGSHIRVRRRDLRFEAQTLRRLLRLSLGGVLQHLVATTSWIALVRIIALFGSAAVAGYTIAVRIILFTILPSWGLGNAAATLVGQNLGAGRPDRAERATWITAFYNMLFLGAITVLFFAAAEPLVGLFTAEPEAARVASDGLRWIATCYVFFAWGMVAVQAFNGAGDTMTPTVLNLICYWIWQIPVAWLLARTLGMGPRGVYAAIASSEILLAVIAVALFRAGRWRTRRV